MLSAGDLTLIIVSTVVCTAVVTGVALVALRLNRRGPIASQFAIVLASTALSIAVSVVVIVTEMFFPAHDLLVLGWIIGIATVLSLVAGWFVLGRAARSALDHLLRTTRELASAGPVPETQPGWKEFNDLAAELARTSRSLADARREIEELDSARRQFLAWIAHDLRTPLAGVRALAEAVETGVAADPHEYANRIHRKIDQLSSMVDDLFELSRLHNGSLHLRREVVPLLDVVSDAVADIHAAAAARGIRVSRVGLEDHLLWADPRELTRAVGNLLTNSVRHSPDGSEILISAAAAPDDRLMLSVLDQGSGVATEDLGRMFDLGWRADPARTSDEHDPISTHAGLGLAIVRGIVEAHGGDVRARHVGQRFSLDIILPTGPVLS